MPYIDHNERVLLDTNLIDPGNAGQLNYKITAIILQYLVRKGTSYQTFNEIIGVLESAKMEFYRRSVSVYEDEKIKKNGDVYE